MLTRFVLSLRTFISDFSRENRAVAAVEFALVLPVLVAIYLATVEITQAISVQRKVAIASGTVGDLTAQYEKMDMETAEVIMSAAEAVMSPYSQTGLSQIEITSFLVSGGAATVDWVCSGETGPMAAAPACVKNGTSTATVPSDLLVDDTSVIVSNYQFSYQSPFGFLPGITGSGSARPLRQTTYYRPRLVTSIPFESSAPSAAWPHPDSGPDAPLMTDDYAGFGPEYNIEPHRVQRGASYENPPAELENYWACETGSMGCNPGGPPYGGGGWGGGGDPGNCAVMEPHREVYLRPICRHEDIAPRL